MKPLTGFWIAIACLAGFCCGQLVLRSIALRDWCGERFHRGNLVALVAGRGIYQVDLDRKLEETTYVAGIEEEEPTDAQRDTALKALIADFAAQSRAANERVSRKELERELNLLRRQFGTEKTWNARLNRNEVSMAALSRIVRGNLTTRAWIARQIANQTTVTDDECRKFYAAHCHNFFIPEKRDVGHLFLAAPPETPPQNVESQRVAVQILAAQLLRSPKEFAVLAAQNSEDEATKLRGGRLGYFWAKRMPPDFVEVASKLQPEVASMPIRTRLGFHILQLIDVQPARFQTFDEARGEIAIEIANQKRQIAVETLSADLVATASYLRSL